MATAVKARPSLAVKVYCTLCTRTVEAVVRLTTSIVGKRRLAVAPGQKCPHCTGSLDAAYVLNNMS